MLTYFKRSSKMYSHFVSYLGFCSAEEASIHNGATLHVAYTILAIPCLLRLWWLQEPGHQQAWYWSPKPEYIQSPASELTVRHLDILYKATKFHYWHPCIEVDLFRINPSILVEKQHYLQLRDKHNSDVAWVSWCLKSLATRLFVQHLAQVNNRESITANH